MLYQRSFQDKNILILGYGKSGFSATKLLTPFAKQIFVYDKNFSTKILNNKLKNNLFLIKKNNFYNILTKNKKTDAASINIVDEENKVFFENNILKILAKNKIHFCIVSPGFDINSKEVKLIKSATVRLVSELELGAAFCRGKIFAITGTNGKTTTSNALFHIFKTAKKQCFLCGNVGTPITEITPLTTNKSLIVCEVSSFQMETTKHFAPYASATLNIQPDHLDRHKTMKNYAFQKTKIFANCKTKKFLNFDDQVTKNLKKKYFDAQYFSLKNKKSLFIIKNNKLLGNFNQSNLLCAAMLAKSAGISSAQISQAMKTFRGLPHRLQFVAKHQNITFVNDSKSTNVASTLAALEAVSGKTILMLGGANKNLCFGDIAKKEIFCVIAFGEAKEKILEDFGGHNTNILSAENFESAFNLATQVAKAHKEDITILLSPACASFDEFQNYAHRGTTFENLVKKFVEEN
ncbi:MAG: UDP-N-acetylmuramoyl-L-alanine--D-glutamate ligase [Clostridia bacterium]